MRQTNAKGIASMSIKVTPNCRYGHGDLLPVVYQGEHPYWGLLSGRKGLGSVFLAELYLCPVCGYLEIFDPSPQITIEHQEKYSSGDGT
jgi:hypothetical protein